MTDYSNEPQNGTLNDSNKVSLYTPADNLGDFPVLKAFQQYINEEQIKAQKRMTLLCALFISILCVVVGVFTILLTSANSNNSRLNDRLLQLALKSSDSTENAAADRSLKTLTDSISQIQSQMGEQQAKLIKEQQSLFEERLKMLTNAKPAENKVELASPKQIAVEKKNRQTEERLRKEMELFKKEKEQLAREKEELRQQQIELQRRKLYPEYYSQATNEPPSQSHTDEKAQPPSRQVQPGYIDYFEQYEEDGDSEVAQAPSKPTKIAPVRDDKPTIRNQKVSAPKPAYDNLTIKSETGESVDWQIPLD